MRTKKKISLTIDVETLEAIEAAAIKGNIAKSQLAQEAFNLWLRQKNEKQMAVGYADMAAEDREFAEMALEA